nr:hypothetical protein CFP56_33966 [Quercus suber]
MRDYTLRSAASCGERGSEIGGNSSGGRRNFRRQYGSDLGLIRPVGTATHLQNQQKSKPIGTTQYQNHNQLHHPNPKLNQQPTKNPNPIDPSTVSTNHDLIHSSAAR